MPSKKYNLVQSPGDDLDSRIPLVPEEAFQHGIHFNVKYIGAMDIPRPTSRVEIVAAMRRVRFEFKSKGIKKKKVCMTVSTEGIRTCIRKKAKGKKKQQLSNVPEIIVESHPIYRIFYVSHDSQDVKIFSYIARETSSSVFHCVVFKAANKSQAMKVVRTVGQAFEVCHKISGPYESSDLDQEKEEEEKAANKKSSDGSKRGVNSSPAKKIPPPINVNQADEFDKDELIESPQHQPPSTPILKDFPPKEQQYGSSGSGNISNVHEVKLLREKLEQATQATNAALAQVNLLRDQLQAESNARIEAQSRTHQLLQHNKELLDHLQSLVHHIQELEGNARQSSSSCSVSPTPLPQVLTSFQEIDALRRQNAALLETILYENNRLSYPHYFMYPHHHPPPPPSAASHLYNNLLINNPHIPAFNPQANSNSSSPSKFYEDYGSFFNRPVHHSAPASSSSVPNIDGSTSIAPAPSILKSSNIPSNRFLYDPTNPTQRHHPHQHQPPPQHHHQHPDHLQQLQLHPSTSGGRRAAGSSSQASATQAAGANSNNNGVQRSVSEKVNNRSELMREVQRSVWARHTTK